MAAAPCRRTVDKRPQRDGPTFSKPSLRRIEKSRQSSNMNRRNCLQPYQMWEHAHEDPASRGTAQFARVAVIDKQIEFV